MAKTGILNTIRKKLTFWTAVFWILIGFGLYATIVRFTQGLGAVTNLSDNVPWGLWVSFDVLCGVGLAAGGFTLAAVVHIFNIKSYEPVIRPAILTAFLGYLLVCVGLIFDLGKPWNIWHPLIMWNHHSVMFEVAWCVMLYTTVLALEFSPVVFEKFRLEKPLRIIKRVTIPLVILGVILSTLHQSSLGSVFLIVPEKMYPLWYSPFLPVFFFISAVMVGFAMVIFESYLSARAFNKSLEKPLLMELARAAVFVMMLFLVLRFIDFTQRGVWGYLFRLQYETIIFWIETSVGVIIPMILLSIPRVRKNENALFWSVVMVVVGFVMNRLDVSIVALQASNGAAYFPSIMEIGITLFLMAVGFGAFRYIAKNFPIFEPTTPIETLGTQKIKVTVKPKVAFMQTAKNS